MIYKSAKNKLPVLTQLSKLIPPHLVSKLARKYGIDKQARTFTAWSHVVSLLFAQLTHSIGLSDICDTLRIHSRWLGSLRGTVAPTRNTLSHTNKTRSSDVMQDLFWAVLSDLENKTPGGFHFRLNLQSFLPSFSIIEEASHHDDTRAPALCAHLQEGEIALFDKAYVNFTHLYGLCQRGVFWVTRAKNNMAYTVRKKLLKKPNGNILRDESHPFKNSKE